MPKEASRTLVLWFKWIFFTQYMLEILTWLETSYRFLSLNKGNSPPPSREQMVWLCQARAPLGPARDALPTNERKPDDQSNTSVEIRNSYSPALPACVGELEGVESGS